MTLHHAIDDAISQLWRYARQHGESLSRETHCTHLRELLAATVARVAAEAEAKQSRIDKLEAQVAQFRAAERKRRDVMRRILKNNTL